MKTEIDFILNAEKKLTIEIPDASVKYNYYYDVTEMLNKYDEVAVYYLCNNTRIEIYKDIIDEFLTVFRAKLKKTLSNSLSLPDRISAGQAGEVINYILNDRSTYDLDSYWVCSSSTNKLTLIYNKNNNIYIEIVPMYPWTYVEPKPEEDYITFEKFMENYKPYVLEIIPYEVADRWLNTCEEIFKQIA